MNISEGVSKEQREEECAFLKPQTPQKSKRKLEANIYVDALGNMVGPYGYTPPVAKRAGTSA